MSAAGVTGNPRVANTREQDRFGVVFEETAGIYNGIQLRIVDAHTGAVTHGAVMASSTGVDLFSDPDIAGDHNAFPGSTRGFVVISWLILRGIVTFHPLEHAVGC